MSPPDGRRRAAASKLALALLFASILAFVLSLFAPRASPGRQEPEGLYAAVGLAATGGVGSGLAETLTGLASAAGTTGSAGGVPPPPPPPPPAPCTVRGTNGADNLVGGPGADVICGYGGDDVLHGRGGPDRLFGGLGDDRLYGESGADDLRPGPGRDVAVGGPGDDRFAAKDRTRDRLEGGPGKDVGVADKGLDLVRSIRIQP